MKKMKNFKEFIAESFDSEVAEPDVKPITKPAPTKTPSRPSPIRKDKPSVNPKPKASAKDVADKFLDLAEGDNELIRLLKKKYGN